MYMRYNKSNSAWSLEQAWCKVVVMTFCDCKIQAWSLPGRDSHTKWFDTLLYILQSVAFLDVHNTFLPVNSSFVLEEANSCLTTPKLDDLAWMRRWWVPHLPSLWISNWIVEKSESNTRLRLPTWSHPVLIDFFAQLSCRTGACSSLSSLLLFRCMFLVEPLGCFVMRNLQWVFVRGFIWGMFLQVNGDK